jgi:hypothetical protein
MKTRFLLIFLILTCFCYTGISQVPKGFNYQAIARDGTGNVLANQSLPVKLAIQTLLTGGTLIYEELFPSVSSNSFGMITLVVGSGTQSGGTAASFSAINWNQTLFLKTTIQYPGTTWTVMGTNQIWSVPYALVADKANGVNSGTKLSVTSTNDAGTDALFEVKRADGQTVFAVYPNAVNIYVPKSTYKGIKGGFAVGGYDGSKAGGASTIQDYFRVTPDSVRIYIDPNPTAAKGVKGGFAVGGYDESKGINSMYFNLTPNNTVNTVAASPQILWYPKKNAFLAGNIHIGHVDSVGNYSTALGYQSRAIGDYSQAFGYKATAFGNYSTSIGKRSVAGVYKSKHNAFALGNATLATGEDSYAFGSAAVASGEKSFAFGSVAIDSLGHSLTTPTTASGAFSTAIGMGAQATNFGSLAFGNSSLSNGYASLALGFYSSVATAANYGVAIGYYAQSNGYYGLAFGLKAKANASGSMAIGSYSTTSTTANYAGSFGYSADALAPYSIAIGYNAQTPLTGSNAGSFGYNASAAGPSSISIGPSSSTGSAANYAGSFGYSAHALAPNSVAVGYNAGTAATATSAGAFGYNALASGVNSVAIGSGATTGSAATDAGSFGKSANANGVGSVAIGPSASTGSSATNAGSFGYTAAANGSNSVAVGYGATTGGADASAFGKSANASGTTSMALGTSAWATGLSSVSIGYSADATSDYSVAMGYDAQSSSLYSMALGYSTLASNTAATSIGYNTEASGLYSTAMGYNSIAYGDKSLALGSTYSYNYLRCRINRLTGEFICSTVTGSVPNIARRAYSAAIGNGNTAEDGGMALGFRNNALSSGSIALGYLNTADTSFAFAAGNESASHGISAIALGTNVTAEASNSVVVGAFNATSTGYNRYSWVETDPLFVVGNGDETTGHDALRVNKNGGAYINGENAYAGLWVTNTNTSSNPNTAFGLGIMSGIQRNKAGLNYYSGYFYSAGGSLGTYNGLYADVRTGGSVDLAEYIYDSNKDTKPADVVVADPNKKESVIKSTKPYQTGVLGVISTKPHMTMGMELITDTVSGQPLAGVSAARLALSGRVPVNVCGENGDIKPGDYLTSSSKPGFAMKWTLLDVNVAKDFDELKKILSENEKRRGAIIGKAVESFSGSGTGKIKMLISLQ